MYILTQHPEVSSRLREEILAQVGPRRQPTYEDIKEMKYLKAFINGVLCLFKWGPMHVVRNSTHSELRGASTLSTSVSRQLYIYMVNR